MRPEEKYFVIRGIRENFQWYEREEGYWLCLRHNHGIDYYRFFKDKDEAEKECEKYREEYRKAIEYIKEGDDVWFIYSKQIVVSKIINIINFGYEMYYQMVGCDENLPSKCLFKSKEDLLNYLESDIQYLK